MSVNETGTSPVLVCAADESYAIPLTVMVRSVLENLQPHIPLRLFILDGGFTRGTRRRLLKSWQGFPVTVTWLEPPLSLLEEFPAQRYVSQIAYLRLFLPSLLPEELNRVIYLDSDLIVLGDLVELWEKSLDGKACLAARDPGNPFVDMGVAQPTVPPYRLCDYPIENYEELGIDPHAEYFNSGVMLINLAFWRRERVEQKFVQCLRDNHRYIRFCDQYILNVVLSGCWGRLDPVWNQVPFEPAVVDEPEWVPTTTNPGIFHFISRKKPWQFPGYRGPERRIFYAILRRTRWNRFNALFRNFGSSPRSAWKFSVSASKAYISIWCEKSPALFAVKRRIRRLLPGGARDENSTTLNVIASLPIFRPGIAGSYQQCADLTIQTANQVFPFLRHLLQQTGINKLRVIKLENFPRNEDEMACSFALKERFDFYRSDKSNKHDYHYIYGPILKESNSITAVLEIGLGTNNIDVVSHMGGIGKPGASLRAFRDQLPNAKIFGADVDKGILFQEKRIQTFFVDQTNLDSFESLGENIPDDIDLIIDDGLHSPDANIAVLTFALGKIKAGGWIVIEDILESALPLWEVVAALLPSTFLPTMIRGAEGLVFVVQREQEEQVA